MYPVATCICHFCHRRVPRDEADRVQITVHAGASGSSISFGTSGKPRISSGRNWYRNKTVWKCYDCIESDRPKNAIINTLLGIAVAISSSVVLYFMLKIFAVIP